MAGKGSSSCASTGASRSPDFGKKIIENQPLGKMQ